jgi:hypothetical protein
MGWRLWGGERKLPQSPMGGFFPSLSTAKGVDFIRDLEGVGLGCPGEAMPAGRTRLGLGNRPALH